MNFDNLMTVAQCDQCIAMLRNIGADVPEALIARRAFLAEHGTTVYADFCARNHPSEELSACIERAANVLLDPGIDALTAQKPVMLYGKIQSGKTRAFVGIMSIAFDRGVDIAIVYTKGTNALAKQTVSRMRDEFVNFRPSDNLRQQCTIVVHDVLDLRAQMLTTYELNTKKHIVICKKEANNTLALRNLVYENTLLRQKRVIVIDDEADFGGIAFYRDPRLQEVLVGTNARNITETVQAIPDCRNMLVTATPYSLYLQPDGMVELVNGAVRALRPRHTEMVPVHQHYIGGEQYFVDAARGDSMFNSVFHPLSPECVNVLGGRDRRYLSNIATSAKLYDFRYAVMQYLVGTAIRSLQEACRGVRYRSSMIVHVEVAKNAHEWQRDLVENLLRYLGEHVFCDHPDDGSFDEIIAAIVEDFVATRNNGEAEGLLERDGMPSGEEIVAKINELFAAAAIHVQIVNSDEDVANLLDASGQLELRHEANIFIGGSILDRGITIENLIGFVYGRSPQRMQMDTVLQHARMYGARKMSDMAVTRFHTTNLLYDRLRRINAMDESLREQFERAMREGRDPDTVFVSRDDRGQIIPTSPSRLLIASISTITSHSRHLPVGFQTDCRTNIYEIVAGIDRDILAAPDYSNRDGDGIFLIDRNLAIDILRRIRATYIYNRPIDRNANLEWDVEETIGILEWALKDNRQLYCLRRENRELSRYRANGSFADAPDDGRTDLAPARAKAIDLPVLMLIRENGNADQGWRDTPFYWPVLVVQQNVRSAVYGNSGQ